MRPSSPLQVEAVRVCGKTEPGVAQASDAPEATERRACALICEEWPTVAWYLGPEVLLETTPGAGAGASSAPTVASTWQCPSYSSWTYSTFRTQLSATLTGRFPSSAAVVDPYLHAGGVVNIMLCEFVALMISAFMNAVCLYPDLAGMGAAELLHFLTTSCDGKPLAELLVDGYRGKLALAAGEIRPLDLPWDLTFAPAVFGMIQWLAVLQAEIRRRVPLLDQLVFPSGEPSTTMQGLQMNYQSVLRPCHGDGAGGSGLSTFGQLLRCHGDATWHRHASRSAARRGWPAQLLRPPGAPAEADAQWAVGRAQLELCALAHWRAAGAASPVASSTQEDGSSLHVVAASARFDRQRGAQVLELMLFSELPCREDGVGPALFCGPHASDVPETPLRRWRCFYPGIPGSRAAGIDAAVVSYYRQATLLACPLPRLLGSNSSSASFEVRLRGFRALERHSDWEASVEVCEKAVPTERKEQEPFKAAICLQPAYNLGGMERAAPKLVEQNLRYHELQGFVSFGLYDYDGTFGEHPTVQRLVKRGAMKYYPRWPALISERVAWQVNSKEALGVTGSRAMTVVELTLTHCMWSYRGEVDFVLLGAPDAFLAIGPPALEHHRCWPSDPSLFLKCCDGALGPVGGFSRLPECAPGLRGRSFEECCRSYEPEATAEQVASVPAPRGLQHLLESIPRAALRRAGMISIGLCEFAAPDPGVRNATIFTHLWRAPTCDAQYYQLVRPTHAVTQNMEWVRIRRNSGIFYVPLEWARVLHVINTHGGRLRCHRRKNSYASNRRPCTAPDHGLRWAFPALRAAAAAEATAAAEGPRGGRPVRPEESTATDGSE